MSQRTLAGVLAVPLLVALWTAAVLAPLPYVTYSPGITVDVLGRTDGEPRVEVSGAETFAAEGELRMTTVYVTRPERRVNIFDVMRSWIDRDEAVYPYDAVYSPEQTRDQVEEEAAVQMASSQDVAAAVALRALGREVEEVVEVLLVRDGLPADGKLEVGDHLVRVGTTEITTPQDVVTAVDAAPVDQPLAFVVERGGKQLTVEVTPRDVDGDKLVGITPGAAYDLPIDVDVNIDPSIGGPSAGLLFTLGIYDTLTPGSLTGGAVVAGTGTMSPDGTVGSIGGIQQKIAAARQDGAELFLVPQANCEAALGARNEDMKLVKVTTMDDAVSSIKSWVEDHDAPIPSCERTSTP